MALVIHKGFFDDLFAGNANNSADLRVLPVMTNTTVDTEATAARMADFTTIDEFDGVGYVQADPGGVAVAWDAANLGYKIDCDDFDWSGGLDMVLVGSRDAQGYLVKRYVDGTPANDVPWGYSDQGGFPFSPSGAGWDFHVAATGLLTVRKKV